MKFLSKNKFFLIIIITLICVISIFLINKNNKNKSQNIILIGNYVDITNVDTSFTSTFMDSNYLYKLLTNDSSKIINNQKIKISKHIKQAKKIIINIGAYEMDNLITKQKNNLIYDKELLSRQACILLENINKICIYVTNITNDNNITLCGLSNDFSYNDFYIDKFYKTLNSKIQSYAKSMCYSYLNTIQKI